MPNLLAVIERVRCKDFDQDDWLYVAGSIRGLTPQTDAELNCSYFDGATSEEILPTGFAERELKSTIDVQTVEECIQWADQLSGAADNMAVLDVIRYYILFDAYPAALNSPDPPSREEILRRLDREFCDKLGRENLAKPCRGVGCHGGAVKLSVFCRRHHFENVKKRPYPFAE